MDSDLNSVLGETVLTPIMLLIQSGENVRIINDETDIGEVRITSTFEDIIAGISAAMQEAFKHQVESPKVIADMTRCCNPDGRIEHLVFDHDADSEANNACRLLWSAY